MKRALVASAVLGALAVVHSSSAFAATPTLLPNSSAPAPKNPSAATGRSGTAQLSVRSLIGMDGKTDVDVTTGTSFATGSAAPGTITKIQLKAFDLDAEVARTDNFTGLDAGGTFHRTFDDLHHGQPIQVQGNIRRVDGKRTDVVTVTGNVKKRPDLAVDKLTAPAKVNKGTRVNIMAVVAEKNGDVGAAGDCRLLLDGVEVDRALGIWVDNGSSVTCAFNLDPGDVGSHGVKVKVDHVEPGDWDLANNEADATIEVVSPGAPMYWSANASSQDYWKSTFREEGYFRRSDGSLPAAPDWTNVYGAEGKRQYSSLWGSSPAGVVFPLAHVEATHKVDGVVIGAVTSDDPGWANWWGDGTNGGGYGCTNDVASNTSVCVDSRYGSDWGWTHAQTSRWAGDYTYYSYGWGYYWWGYGNYSYSVNSGTFTPYGATFAIDLRVEGASGTAQASASFATEAFTNAYDFPYQCWDYSGWGWGYGERYCREQHYTTSGRQGWSNGVTNP